MRFWEVSSHQPRADPPEPTGRSQFIGVDSLHHAPERGHVRRSCQTDGGTAITEWTLLWDRPA